MGWRITFQIGGFVTIEVFSRGFFQEVPEGWD